VQASAGKVMLSVFWDENGVIFTDYLQNGVTITAQYYINLLEKVRDAIKQKRRGMISKGILLLHDNAPAHTAHATTAAASRLGYHILPQPAYSPDLAASDFFLFRNLKKELSGRRFSDNEEVINAVESWFARQKDTFYKDGIRQCRHRWEKCVVLEGDYVEKD